VGQQIAKQADRQTDRHPDRQINRRTDGWAEPSPKPLGYTWSYLACRIGRSVQHGINRNPYFSNELQVGWRRVRYSRRHSSLKPIGYTWSRLACRIGHLFPIRHEKQDIAPPPPARRTCKAPFIECDGPLSRRPYMSQCRRRTRRINHTLARVTRSLRGDNAPKNAVVHVK
jgi:hypothetical protein